MSTPLTKKGGQGHEREPQLGLLTGTPSRALRTLGVAPVTQAVRQVTGRLLNLLLDEFLDRPTPPGPLWKPAKGSADRWT